MGKANCVYWAFTFKDKGSTSSCTGRICKHDSAFAYKPQNGSI